jgi:hypothetical protein
LRRHEEERGKDGSHDHCRRVRFLK